MLLIPRLAAISHAFRVVSAASTDNLVLILDASGSMWGRVGGETKIEAARRVVRDLTVKLPTEARLGLVAYGHRQKGDCNDIEELVAPAVAVPLRFQTRSIN
ncbi:MAG: VWA domain-containing protein [Bryobacterales bacterium]